MALESTTYIDGLVKTNPLGSDSKGQGDDHLRLIKSALKNTFPNSTQPFYFPTTIADKSANYTVLATDDGQYLSFDASAAARTITLPATASLADGFTVYIIKVDSGLNAVTVNGNGGDEINGASSFVLRLSYDFAKFVWSGENSMWYVTQNRGMPSLVTKTSAYSADITDHDGLILADVSSAAFTVTLPTAPPNGYRVTVSKKDTGSNSVTVAGAVNINNAANFLLTKAYQSATFWYDSANSLWWTPHQDWDQDPIGFVKYWGLEALPSDGKYLQCDGSAVSRTTYSDLFDLWSTYYGAGDGSTTFHLLDLRGRFVRGWDDGAATDPDAADRTKTAASGATMSDGDHVGTEQDHDIDAHEHTIDYNLGSSFQVGAGAVPVANLVQSGGTTTINTTAYPTSDGDETRPLNTAANFIVKALPD